MHIPLLNVFSLNYHYDGWAQVEVSQLISSFQMVFFCDMDTHNIESSNHHHRHQPLAPLGSDSDSSIFLVNRLSFGNCPFRNTVAPAFNSDSIDDIHLDRGMESMVISWSQVNN